MEKGCGVQVKLMEEILMMVNTFKIKKMDMENINGYQEMYIKEILRVICVMAMENLSILMGLFKKVNIYLLSCLNGSYLLQKVIG